MHELAFFNQKALTVTLLVRRSFWPCTLFFPQV